MNTGNTGTWSHISAHDLLCSSGSRLRAALPRLRWKPIAAWRAVLLLAIGYAMILAGLLV